MFEFWSRRQRVFSLWLLLLFNCLVQQSESFVVPQELPSLLSVIYSNIPIVKKGTDSRLGFGYRLGDHADFQVVIELGPQKNTRPLGDNAEEQSFSKRQTTPEELRMLQRQLLKQQIRQKQEEYLSSTERTAATWLQSWSQDMNGPMAQPSSKPLQKTKTKSQGSFKIAQTPKPPLPTQPNMEAQAVAQLQQLYKMATSTTEATSTTTTTSSTTTPAPFKGGRLNLGGPSGFKLLPPVLTQESNLLTIGETNTKTKSEITKELMDVRLEDEAATP